MPAAARLFFNIANRLSSNAARKAIREQRCDRHEKTTGSNNYGYSYTYPQKHAVSSISLNGGAPAVFSYDANGNMTGGPDFTDTAATGTRTLTYTMDNMPATITYNKSSNTSVSEFTYDGANARAKKKVGGSTTYYVNVNYEVKDGVVTKYITAADMKVAQIKDSTVAYYHKDHLNSATVMTNATGTKLEGTAYAPYGTIRAFTGTAVTSYRYTGKELDSETGLYYYGARYYDPMIGRFISADSIVSDVYDPQDLNRYAYARNNPMKYVDPDGHAFKAATMVFRVGQALYKGYGLYSTVSGIVEDTQTILDSKASNSERLWAAGSLIADLSGAKDVVGAAKGMYKCGRAVLSVAEDVGHALKMNAKKCPNPFGQAGKQDHKNTVEYLKEKAKSEYPDGTSIKKKTRINRRPDVWVENADTGKVEKVYEAARKNKSGDNFVSREIKKRDEYDSAKLPNHFEAVQ